MQNYVKVLQQLYNINKFKCPKFNLDHLNEAATYLGVKNHKFDTIHVVGTNGKGSITLKLSNILQKSGLKTGTYTSPHLFSFRERIQVNQQLIEQDYLVNNLEEVINLNSLQNWKLTYFEVITLVCLKYFHHEKVDVAVMEAGLGGTLDATNIIKPKLCIIGQIGLDHCRVLGDTVEQIARSKAGVIKKGAPVILGPHSKPYSVFLQKAKEVGAPAIIVEEDANTIHSYENENNKVVLTAAKTLKNLVQGQFTQITQSAMQEGIKIKQKCRNEVLDKERYAHIRQKKKPEQIIFDVGHNPSGIQRMLDEVDRMFPGVAKRVVLGMSSTKDSDKILEILSHRVDHIHFVAAEHDRAKPMHAILEDLDRIRRQVQLVTTMHKTNGTANENYSNGEQNQINIDPLKFEPTVQQGSIGETMDFALDRIDQSEKQEILIVTGSFFIMREAREFLHLGDFCDPIELQRYKGPTTPESLEDKKFEIEP